VADLWSGDAAAALANFVRAEEAADAIGLDDPGMRYWRGEYVDGLVPLGRVDDAARLVDDWESAARQLRRERVLAQVARCRGVIAAARGDMSVALDLLEESVIRHEAADDPFGRLRALLSLGVVKRRLRQKRAAREALEAERAGFAALEAASWVASAEAELGRIGGARRIEGLSSSELSVATLVAEERTNREIAAALFLGERTVASHLTHIYGKLGIRSRTELARHMLPRVSDPADGATFRRPDVSSGDPAQPIVWEARNVPPSSRFRRAPDGPGCEACRVTSNEDFSGTAPPADAGPEGQGELCWQHCGRTGNVRPPVDPSVLDDGEASVNAIPRSYALGDRWAVAGDIRHVGLRHDADQGPALCPGRFRGPQLADARHAEREGDPDGEARAWGRTMDVPRYRSPQGLRCRGYRGAAGHRSLERLRRQDDPDLTIAFLEYSRRPASHLEGPVALVSADPPASARASSRSA